MKQNYYPQCVVYKQQKIFCPCTVDCSPGFLAKAMLAGNANLSPWVGGREGAAVRNDRYSQGQVTKFL